MDKTFFRQLFPVTQNCVYFNHAAVGPLSQRSYDAMEAHARQQRDWGATQWREWYGEHAKLRREAARLLNAQPDDIAILKNTSEGLAFVAEGIRWAAGDNAITTDMEFPSNFVPWKRLERRGVECRIIRNRAGAFGVEDIEPLIDTRTRVVSVSSVSFHNGFAPDLVAIGELCASKRVLFCVDAIQSLGAIPLDVREAKVSFLAADGHKWLLGPEGTAVFFTSEEGRESLEVLEAGWMNVARGGKFINCATDLLPDARRFESGSLNTNGIYGLEASISLINEIGIEVIEREVVGLATRLAERLETIGFEVRTPRPIRSGIIGAIPPAVDSARLQEKAGAVAADLIDVAPVVGLIHRYLELNGVICAPREGMLRFSPHFYNDDREIDRVIELLEEIV